MTYERRDKQAAADMGMPQWLRRYLRQYTGGKVYAGILSDRIEHPEKRRDRRGRKPVRGHPLKVRALDVEAGFSRWVQA